MDTFTTIRASLANYTSSLFRRVRVNDKPAYFYPAVLVGALGSFVFARAAYADYQVYLGLGPGGMPYNVFGWILTSTVVRALTVDTLDTRKLESDQDQPRWLREELPQRQGVRPTMGPHPIPQRQLDQLAPEGVKEYLLASFASVVAQNPTLIQFKSSQYERRHDAIFIADTCPASTKDILGYDFPPEISHVHPNADYSVHVVLAPRDAAKVIKAGWGQLHGFAGVSVAGRQVVPKSYVLLYAPRSEQEVEVIMEIVKAGVAYMTGSKREDVK